MSEQQEVVKLSVAIIRRDAGTQMRPSLDEAHLKNLEELLLAGVALDPIQVTYDGTSHYVTDGFHRLRVLERNGRALADAVVQPGTLRLAVLRAAGANKEHRGLIRDRATKRAAALAFLTDAECKEWSDGKIADAAGVTRPFIYKLRQELAAPSTSNITRREQVMGRDGRTYDVSQLREARQTRAEERRAPVDLSSPPPGYQAKGGGGVGRDPERTFAGGGKGSVLATFAPGRERVAFSEEAQPDPEELAHLRPCPRCGGTGVVP